MAATASSPVTLPPKDVEAVDEVARVLSTPVAKLVGPDGVAVELPVEVHELLSHVVDALRHGQAITVAPVSMRLTTSQAAEMLGLSRPTLVRLLEEHEVPFERTSRHRRVRLDDLLAYRERRRVERRSALYEMTRQAVADGLYDDSGADYADALKEARKSGDSR